MEASPPKGRQQTDTNPAGQQQQQPQQQQQGGFSPLSAGLHGQRSSRGSPRSSSDSLLDAEQLPQSQLPQQHWQQQQQQQDALQEQQQPHGIAYVSVNGNSSRDGASGSPRSPSRLRYVRKDGTAAQTAAAAAAAATAPHLPDFLEVQELPPGVLHEDEVEIVHQEGDEVQRHADVEDKIIRQVDQLVEYFNSLFHDDQLDISTLQHELATRDMELSKKNLLIQQLMSARQQQQMQVQQAAYQGDGLWAAVRRSWQRSRWCWVAVMLLLVALILVIALPAGLVKRPGPGAPAFLYQPQLLAATNASMDFKLAVSKPAVVHYVLLPKSGGATGWDKMSAADVQTASQGLGWSGWESKVAACGVLYMPTASADSTFSVTGVNTPECIQQQAAVAAGGQHSCSRCPMVDAETEFDVLLVAEASGAASSPQHITAATLPGYASRAPMLKGGAAVRATSSATSEATFDLTFQMNAAGTVKFLVLYANMYARFMDTYVVFDNAVTEPSALLDTSIAGFQNGVVARGQITVQQAGVDHTCTIGGSGAGSACRCTPAAACVQEASCFGSLCDYSRVSLAPSTAYKVVLVPVSLDGNDLGSPAQLPSFSTGDALIPPRLSDGLGINPVVGPDRFSVYNISQDKPGFAYLLVTKPHNQVNSQVPAGTATPFTQVAGARRSRGTRQLTEATSTNVLVLPPEQGASISGSAFLPPCRTALACEAYMGSAREYLSSAAETVVFQKCVPIAKITKEANALVTSLANNTLYKVTIIPTDSSNNQDAWTAFVRTQDLSPPVLTIMDTPPPDFDSFTVIAQLDEPGTLYAALVLSSQASQVTATVGCPPAFQGPLVGQNTYAVSAGRININISWAGLAANTDYLLRLVAVDTVGNCQPSFTDVPVHTLDNIPPNTLGFDVVQIGGTFASLQLTLDEPGTVSYAIMPQATACPARDVLFAAASAMPPGAVAAGNASVPQANVAAATNVSGLTSETDYTACVIAADVTRLQNRQASVASKPFRTLDITPPVVSLSVVRGPDGNFTCDRTSFLCSLSFSAGLNEPGSITWVLARAANASNTSQLPSPMQLLGATDASAFFIAGSTPTGSMTVTAAGLAVNATVPALASQMGYTLVVAAKDAAPQANFIPALMLLQLTAPDVRPPTFTDVHLQGTTDTTVAVSTTLDEPSTVFFVVAPHPSVTPTPAQVSGGLAANGTQPVTSSKASAAFNTSLLLTAEGLLPGSWYDIYLVAADDPAGNMQTRVTNITRVRTTDSVPPVITDLTATFTPPMSLTLTYTVSKAGSLLLAPRKAGQPVPTAADVLAEVASQSRTEANFTAAVPVATTATTVTQVLCVADGDQLVVHAVAKDTEGQWSGRQDNTSPLTSVPVTLQPAVADASCPSLAYLQPTLAFTTGVASQGLSLPGLLLGPRTASAPTAGSSMMQQTAVAFMDSVVSGAGLQLQARVGAISAASDAIKLPGSTPVTLRPWPPAQIAAILQSVQLVPDANSNDGSLLRISYQLKDSAGRTHVDTAGLVVRPVLSYAADATPPAGAQAVNNALPDCDVGVLGAASGIGQCSVVVDRRLFPATGALAASVTIRVWVGTTQVASAEVSGLQLLAPPTIPAFAPSSQPGLLVTMPYRSVYFGETVKVSLQAVNPLMQGLTGFTLPLRYDKTLLELREVRSGELWQPAAVTTRADGGNFEVTVLSAGRSGAQGDTAYRADTSGILLADIFFTVRATRTGTAANAITLVTSPTANIPSALSLWPSWASPYYQFNNFNGASSSAGSLQVGATSTLGMWAWADTYELFNTAALNGQQVSTSLRGTLVRSYGALSSSSGDALSGCVVGTAAGAPRAAAVAIDALRRVCSVNVNAVNAVPAKQLLVTLSIADGVSADQTAQVSLNVWYPSNLALSAADTTLNSVLPINAAPSTPSCSAFQSTALQLTASWSNGGSGPADTLVGTDVTGLASFSSNDTNVAQVVGAMVKGVSPGRATISTAASSSLKLPITVSSEAACLLQLHTAATTGAAAAVAAQAAAATTASTAVSPQGLQALRPNQPFNLTWQARQDLAWEDSSALVLSYARFSDGSVMDVTDKTAVTAAAGVGGSGVLPFTLSSDNTTGLSWLTVAVTVGTSVPCQQYLQSSWAVCSNSVRLGTGQGSVAVKLPNPTAVANFSASPVSITSSDNPARLNPIHVATSSRLALQLAFDDGVVRDFSRDSRVVFGLAPGPAMCEVMQDTGGGWQVVTAAGGSALSGSCTITATITFQGPTAPLTATTSVTLVGLTHLAVYALEPDVAAVPAAPPAGGLVAADELVLLQCAADSYDQRSVWTYGVLSNCTSSNACPMVDINSRQYTVLNSSNRAAAQILAGTSFNSYPLLDNVLTPTATGNSLISSTFAATASRSFTLTVRDTYQPNWPAAAALSDTSARVDANLSDASLLTVTYLMLPSTQLDLLASPPSMPSLADVQAGVSLVPYPTRGLNFLTATSTGLAPGTNYTVLAAVRLSGSAGGAASSSSTGSSSGQAASPSVVALTGLLVPDTAPPSFTKTAVKGVKPTNGSATGVGSGTFTIQLDLGLSEDGRVYYAVYRDPGCITADPSPAEIVSGVNLADVGKCSCASRYCTAAAFGALPISSSNGSAVMTLRANLPPFPFDNLGADATCSDFVASNFASTEHAVYLVAEDKLPTYKGWTSVCSMPPPTGTPAPCPAVSIGRCRNTPPAVESVNRQAPPFTGLDLYTDAAASTAPLGSPIKGVARLVDPVQPGFVAPTVVSTGTSVVWTFQTTKPGLVQWRLVEQVTHVVANGLMAVTDASLTYTVPISRKCSGQQLVPATAYALWYNMTDIYGTQTDVSILKVTL